MTPSAAARRLLTQPPAQVADRRHEQEQADNVGDKAGNEQQYAGEQDHDAMRDFAAGVLALGQLLADAGEHAKSLQAQQRAADDAAQDDQRQVGRTPISRPTSTKPAISSSGKARKRGSRKRI